MNDIERAAMAARDASQMRAVVSQWLSAFEAALTAGDAKAIAALCESGGVERGAACFVTKRLRTHIHHRPELVSGSDESALPIATHPPGGISVGVDRTCCKTQKRKGQPGAIHC